jgi:hypothetical protein
MSSLSVQQSAIAVCNLPTHCRTPDSTLQRTSFWNHSQMVGSHIAKEEVTEYESYQNPHISPYLFLLVSILLLCVCVSLSLSWLLPILLPWSKHWQNFL